MNVHDPNGNLPVIRAHYADILCQLAEELGVPRGALLGAAGIRRSLLGHPDNCLTVAQFTRLCEAALIRTGDDALGLAFGLRLKFTTHGSLAQAAISCDTLAEALSVLIRYFQTRFAYMTLVFFTDGDEAVLQLDPGHAFRNLYRFNVDVVMASLVDVGLLLFGDRLMTAGRCLVDFPAPADPAPYRRLFADRITFSAGVNQLRFACTLLELPMALSNPVARRVAEAQCEQELRSLQTVLSARAQVRRCLGAVREGRLPGLDEVARQLGWSSRTLRRRLASEGCRFQTLQEEVQHQRALVLLRRRALTLEDVAEALGYSDPSNFARAFRKWEGMAPAPAPAGRRHSVLQVGIAFQAGRPAPPAGFPAVARATRWWRICGGRPPTAVPARNSRISAPWPRYRPESVRRCRSRLGH